MAMRLRRLRVEINSDPGPERLPESDYPATVSTLEAVLDDFTESWERDEHPRAERYVGLLRPEDSAELIYHEYCLAEASDLAPDPADYLRRFPEQAGPLGRLFALHDALSVGTLRDWAEPSGLPSAGDEIGPYQTTRELGRGAFARVFLAEQTDLDCRLVVLKVSTRLTAEAWLLARVRHPHIVEVLRHAVANDGALHLFGMPFLGGATLASVLDERRNLTRRPRSGLELLADLDRVSAPEYASAPLAGPARELIARLSYPKALAWIVARLAEALDHAHRRGVAHGDLKPSNVLLTAEGVPMLFDFNLSVDCQSADPDDLTADLGGTLGYMAPERLRAIAEGGRGRTSNAADLHRADLYSLGLLLLESLTGQAPEVPRARANGSRELAGTLARLRRELPDSLRGGSRTIPTALRSILTHCLAPNPIDRYTRADELAEDLDCWRLDRPLSFADEPRHSTLTRRVRRRRAPLIVLGLTLATSLIVTVFASRMIQGSKRDEALSKYSMVVSRSDSGVFGFRWNDEWRADGLGNPLELATRQLARYEILGNPGWQARDDVRALPDREREELEVWLFEQILRYSVALGEAPESPGDWTRALALLEHTLARTASSPLESERLALRARLKRSSPEAVLPKDRPRLAPWMEEYLAGVAAEPLHARDALNHYLEVLRDRPGLFWAHFRAAIVACRINEYDDAADHFRSCIARYPENPALHLQLATALIHAEHDTPEGQKLGYLADSLEECERALALDPDYSPVFRVRANIRKDCGWPEGAKADLDRYAMLMRRSGPGPMLALTLALNFRSGPNFGPQPDKVESLARKILDYEPRDHATRTTLGVLIAQSDRSEEALAEYDRVLEEAPGHLRARFRRAEQLYKINPSVALPELAAIIKHPRFEELFPMNPAAIRAFHYVATDLMKRGKNAEALEIANQSLIHINRSRSLQTETILAHIKANYPYDFSPRGETYYLLARIHAAAVTQDPQRLGLVLDNLGRAFACNDGFRSGWFKKDPRFDNLRQTISQKLNLDKFDR